MASELSDLIDTLWRIKRADALPNYIDYIQFPFFRNLELDQRINFEYPLTVFVGPNGSGKSSTLHALQGCPYGYTPYKYWFSTVLDPVVDFLESRKLRHSFFYGYRDNSGQDLQVAKARIRRENNPDYWETSRPLLSYGMLPPPEGKERNEPISKNVLYFDFRSELSAFDKYFYFESPPSNLVSKTKQDYLRKKSTQLRGLLYGWYSKISSPSGHTQNEDLILLSGQELFEVSNILGKEYSEGKIIRHKLFHTWGYSIYLKTAFHQYSEAFAGSGEVAIVRLVHELLTANEGSLVLLDEPEVSLHPGAQKRLKHFLLEQIKERKHQVIISTHSPALIEGLPKESIKVFFQKQDSGKFIIKENISPEEAFYFIGQDVGDKIHILVEDKLSKKILDRVISIMGEEVNNLLEVKIYSGGASVLQQHISVYSNANILKSFFVFDGDQKRLTESFDVRQLNDSQKTIEYLKNKIIEQTGVEIKFYPDGGPDGGNQSQIIQMMIAFLSYYRETVFYLPKPTPEDIIWSEETIQQRLNSEFFNEHIDMLRRLRTNKERIMELSKLLFGDYNREAMEDILLTEWLQTEDSQFQIIINMVRTIEALSKKMSFHSN